jgi:hypothetical protein
MEAIRSFETSVDFQPTTRRYIPEDSTLYNYAVRTSNPTQFLSCVRICCRGNQLSHVVYRPLRNSGWLLLLNCTVVLSHYQCKTFHVENDFASIAAYFIKWLLTHMRGFCNTAHIPSYEDLCLGSFHKSNDLLLRREVSLYLLSTKWEFSLGPTNIQRV